MILKVAHSCAHARTWATLKGPGLGVWKYGLPLLGDIADVHNPFNQGDDRFIY